VFGTGSVLVYDVFGFCLYNECVCEGMFSLCVYRRRGAKKKKARSETSTKQHVTTPETRRSETEIREALREI